MKKNILLPALFFIGLSSCVNEPQKKERAPVKKEKVEASEKLLVLPYTAVFNAETQEMELKHNPVGDPSKLNVRDMIDALNLKYPQIILEEIKKSNDTLYVKIDEATYLTQQIGTEGATTYLAEATFALTEPVGIHVVDFSFKEGDHAVPKPYTRESFKDFN